MSAKNTSSPQDKLDEIFKMQRDFASMASLDRYPDGAEERISALCTAIIHETTELQRTTSWKWWKTPTAFDRGQAVEELVDICHFVIQAAIELDLSPEELLREYKRKNAINRKRQETGY